MSFTPPRFFLPPTCSPITFTSSKNMRFNLSTVAVVLATMGLTQGIHPAFFFLATPFDIGLASLLLPRNPLYEILNSRQAPPGVWKLYILWGHLSRFQQPLLTHFSSVRYWLRKGQHSFESALSIRSETYQQPFKFDRLLLSRHAQMQRASAQPTSRLACKPVSTVE